MKFTIFSKAFKEIIDRAAACADKKSKNPICGCVEIYADKDQQTVHARCISIDRENNGAQSEVWANVDVSETGSAVVNLDDIKNIFNLKDKITVETDSEKLIASNGKKRSELGLAAAFEFPEFKYINNEFVFEADKEDFLDTLKKLSPFTADTDVKKIHTGYNVDCGRICALDSHCLALREYPWISGKMPFNGNITLPGRIFDDMRKISKNKQEESVVLYTDRESAMIQGSDFLYTFTLLRGDFMKYDSVIPKEKLCSFRVNANALGEIAKEYSGFLNAARLPMYLAYNDGNVYAVGLSPTYRTFDILETGDEDIAQDYIQAFQAKFIKRTMDIFEDSAVRLEFSGRKIDPMCFSGKDGYFALILPVRYDEREADKVREFISADKAA